MFDDFETQIQIEEIIPEEYEDWLDSLIEEHAKVWLHTFAEEYAATWAPGGCDWEEDEATIEFEPGRVYWDEMAANP